MYHRGKRFVGEDMFGYVKVDKPELRVREYEYYRGVYCGLCRALGKCGGQCARLTLSYDFAFMALVRMAIENKAPAFSQRRCVAHPFHKHNIADNNSALEFCAAASLLLAYGKNRDDIADEKGLKRLSAAVASPFLSMMKRRPSKRYKDLEVKIAESLHRLSELERESKEVSVDRPAELVGELLGEIMAEGLEGSKARVGRKIGRHIGKWIYIADAIDDYDEDVKKGRYNPLMGFCGRDRLSDESLDSLENALTGELMEAEKGFDLIDYPDREIKAVIENIIYLGMPKRAREIMKKERERKKSDDRSV